TIAGHDHRDGIPGKRRVFHLHLAGKVQPASLVLAQRGEIGVLSKVGRRLRAGRILCRGPGSRPATVRLPPRRNTHSNTHHHANSQPNPVTHRTPRGTILNYALFSATGTFCTAKARSFPSQLPLNETSVPEPRFLLKSLWRLW